MMQYCERFRWEKILADLVDFIKLSSCISRTEVSSINSV